MTTRLDLKTFKLDSEGDIVINENKDIQLVENEEEAAQAIRMIFTQDLGAWKFNTLFGLDRRSFVKKGATDDERFRLMSTALNVEERVESLENFKKEQQERHVNISANVVLIDGTTVGVEV